MSDIVGSCYVCFRELRVGERVSTMLLPGNPVQLCQGCADDVRGEYGGSIREIDLDRTLSSSGDRYVRVSRKRRSVSKKELLKRKAQRKRK